MSAYDMLLALALVLVLEGLMPFISPQSWRNLFAQIVALQDGQIRFFGLIAILLGLGLFVFLTL
jgi:uncharacterized protein YjeT (DUF2065 family)